MQESQMEKMKTYTLEHHGIKGMKWGVRRTPEELGHKPKISEKQLQGIKETVMTGSKSARTLSNKIRSSGKNKVDSDKISKMSDTQLREVLNRLRMEEDYKRLLSNKQEINSGKAFISNVLDLTGDALAVAGGALSTAILIKKLMNN